MKIIYYIKGKKYRKNKKSLKCIFLIKLSFFLLFVIILAVEIKNT